MPPQPDRSFHLRMAALLIAVLFLDHLATRHLPAWSSPRITLLPFVVGLLWVGSFAWQHLQRLRARQRQLENDLQELEQRTHRLEQGAMQRRALPPL